MTRSAANLICGRRTKYLVLLFWVAVIAIAGPLAGKLTEAEENDNSAWLPEGAESTQVLELEESFRDTDEVPAIVVYERPDGITDADRATAAEHAATLTDLDHIGEVQGPIPSEDGEALELVVPINMGEGGWETLGEVVGQDGGIRDVVGSGEDGPSVNVTGPGGVAADFAEVFDGIDGRLLLAAASVVIVILLLTYRSPLLWALPVISAMVALTTAQAVVYLFADSGTITVNAQSVGIMTVLIFGAGADYALLLVARYREELRRHQDRHEAMSFALHRAGPAIIASGLTVLVGMFCLVFAELNSTSGMGPVLSIGIAVGLLAMLTLLPALLVIVGRWIFWPVRPTFGSVDHTTEGIWARIGARISRRPRLVWVVTSLALGALALGIVRLDANGLTNEEAFTNTPDSIVGQDIFAEHFGAGGEQPVVVISNADGADEVQSAFAETPGISNVEPAGEADGLVMMTGTLEAAPDSSAAQETVSDARDAVHAVPEADAQVGGDSAILLDTLNAAESDNQLIIPIVLIVVFFILAVLLRALLAPLLLIATVVLSFAAALGISALVFEYILGFEGADAGFPLFVFVFLVALGIDYNIFLMTRVREEAHKYGTRRGALIGLASTGGVITAAGLVLAGTFAALAVMPMVFMAEIGFAVALGVLLDTIIVRAILVTALNLDIGAKMWWPSGLSKKPDVTPDDLVEGEPALVR
ncbi:MAG: MMPL family transporter [Propionibacteriales bacterium]|nr:MMPL family transporter [Propionibacteriales bacterium]